MTVVAPECSVTVQASFGRAPEGWDRGILDAGGNAFHSSAMGEVALARGGEAVYLGVARGGRVGAWCVAEAGRSRLPIVGPRRSTMALCTMPVLDADSDVTLQQAMDAIRAFAAQAGFGRIRITSFADPHPEASARLCLAGCRVEERMEFRVPLLGDLESTLCHMSLAHRRNVRKGLAEGFAFTEDSSLHGAMTLRDLQEVTYARRNAHGNPGARPWERGDYRVVMRTLLAAKAIRFWFVEREGRPLSGMGVLTFGPWAYFLVGGTSHAGYASHAAFALFGRVIDRLTAEGIRELNLGGITPDAEDPAHMDHGLYRFKAGFGAAATRCRTAEGAA